jgi:hypothetical protein
LADKLRKFSFAEDDAVCARSFVTSIAPKALYDRGFKKTERRAIAMSEFEVPETSCPWCGHEITHAGDPFGIKRPKPGDISICAQCAGFLQLGTDLSLKKLEPSTEVYLMTNQPEAYANLLHLQSVILERVEGDRTS